MFKFLKIQSHISDMAATGKS